MIKKRFVDLPIFNFHVVSVADEKANNRPVSIFPLFFKVYERRMFKQLSNHTKYFLSQILCGFRKAHSTQHALFRLLQS